MFRLIKFFLINLGVEDVVFKNVSILTWIVKGSNKCTRESVAALMANDKTSKEGHQQTPTKHPTN